MSRVKLIITDQKNGGLATFIKIILLICQKKYC